MITREELEALKREHRECEDSWYTCALAPDAHIYSSNPNQTEGVCTCGASAHNARVDVLIAKLEVP